MDSRYPASPFTVEMDRLSSLYWSADERERMRLRRAMDNLQPTRCPVPEVQAIIDGDRLLRGADYRGVLGPDGTSRTHYAFYMAMPEAVPPTDDEWYLNRGDAICWQCSKIAGTGLFGPRLVTVYCTEGDLSAFIPSFQVERAIYRHFLDQSEQAFTAVRA